MEGTNKISFLKEGLKNLKTVGSIARSSRFLCKNIVNQIDFSKADIIIELGAGDGVITRHILQKMKPDAKLLAFEINPIFCNHLRTNIKDERLQIIEDSAENIAFYLKKNNATHSDFIVSALPFVALPDELAYSIVQKCAESLQKGGLFIQFHYSLISKKIYQEIFGNSRISFVPLNIPPAFIFVCEK